MDNYVEFVGYAATVLLIISFLPRKVRYIRAINCFGCIVFVIYGIMLGMKWPIILSNGIIAIIQIYHLFWDEKVKNDLPEQS